MPKNEKISKNKKMPKNEKNEKNEKNPKNEKKRKKFDLLYNMALLLQIRYERLEKMSLL